MSRAFDWEQECPELRATHAREIGLRRAVWNVIEAIENEGRVPRYHREVMRRHRAEWPTLWRALDALRRAL